jgi:hypothetical protein
MFSFIRLVRDIFTTGTILGTAGLALACAFKYGNFWGGLALFAGGFLAIGAGGGGTQGLLKALGNGLRSSRERVQFIGSICLLVAVGFLAHWLCGQSHMTLDLVDDKPSVQPIVFWAGVISGVISSSEGRTRA